MTTLEKRLHSIASEPLLIIAAAAVIFSAISLYELRDFPWPHDLNAACTAILKLAPDTGATAIKVWAFWAWSALLIAGFVRKLDPDVEWFDASLIGMTGVWVLAYFAGTLLGPVGLFRGPTLWLLTLGATVYLWPNISGVAFGRPSFGIGLALIAAALAAVSLLPLQLGSPVAPYMDVLAWPASAQRVLTFGTYLPFNNDPYGIFGPNVQQPALELFYAYLALGSHTRLAVLAESSLIFPIAALMILATYRLGATLFDDVTAALATPIANAPSISCEGSVTPSISAPHAIRVRLRRESRNSASPSATSTKSTAVPRIPSSQRKMVVRNSISAAAPPADSGC